MLRDARISHNSLNGQVFGVLVWGIKALLSYAKYSTPFVTLPNSKHSQQAVLIIFAAIGSQEWVIMGCNGFVVWKKVMAGEEIID